ncbi:NAD(P)-binding domain-containing protein [Lentilitoribacter sp. EG35]|uniref:NAD(P)-binding domain-containing protein n=1 Tax=Lentilitoribacter sp. EG35 TaxID=3234192 RepID=UPI00346155DC
MKTRETVVIGAGQSGLAMSYELASAGIEHVVLERGQVANSWRKERWDSLRLLTPNWMNGLAGLSYQGRDHDGFMTNAELISQFTTAAKINDTPIQCQTNVMSVRERWNGYMVQTDNGAIVCNNVVMANGGCGVPKIPSFAASLHNDIVQYTPQNYKRPTDLPDGDVLIVGASASGMQLAQEIQKSGRQVTLAVGNHLRFPRDYRGVDILGWMDLIGVFSQPYDKVDDLERVRRTPSLTLVGSDMRETIDLNSLQKIGVEIVGRLSAIRDDDFLFSGALSNLCKAADLKLERLLRSIDDWLEQSNLTTLFPMTSAIPSTGVPEQSRLKLRSSSVRTVIWATGFLSDFSWLDLPVFDRKGRLVHDGGVVAPGLYALGLPYMRTRKSTHIHGAQEDAQAIAHHICNRLQKTMAA